MNKRGLTTLEFCVLIIAVIFGLWGMTHYLRRALEGSWRSNANSFSEAQYDSDRSVETNHGAGGVPAGRVELVAPAISIGQNIVTTPNLWGYSEIGKIQMRKLTTEDDLDSEHIKTRKIGADTLLQVRGWGTYD